VRYCPARDARQAADVSDQSITIALALLFIIQPLKPELLPGAACSGVVALLKSALRETEGKIPAAWLNTAATTLSVVDILNLKNAVEIFVKNSCNSILARVCVKKSQLLRVCHESAGGKQRHGLQPAHAIRTNLTCLEKPLKPSRATIHMACSQINNPAARLRGITSLSGFNCVF